MKGKPDSGMRLVDHRWEARANEHRRQVMTHRWNLRNVPQVTAIPWNVSPARATIEHTEGGPFHVCARTMTRGMHHDASRSVGAFREVRRFFGHD